MRFPCVFCEDNYGKLLLSALPVAELRRMGRGLGTDAKFRKGCLVEKLCAAATKQRLLQTKQKPYEAVEAEIRGGKKWSVNDLLRTHLRSNVMKAIENTKMK